MTIQQLIQYIKSSKRHSCFYHLTDEDNIPSIRQHGLLSTDSRQKMGIVPSHRGGNEYSFSADSIKNITDFVCLSFTYDHPLCFLSQQDARILDPVCLKITPDILLVEGVMFADGVANATSTTLSPIADSIEKIDLEVIYQYTDWKDSAINARLQKAKKAEILVPKSVPVKMIIGRA